MSQSPRTDYFSGYDAPNAPSGMFGAATPPYAQPTRRASGSFMHSSHVSPAPSPIGSLSQSWTGGRASPIMYPSGSIPHPLSAPEGSMSPTLLRPLRPQGLERYGPEMHVPGVSGAQSYQILTEDANKEYMRLPVEVQAASRMADEKRKRIAGASARFRARRKEKEREANNRIFLLERKLAHAQEDARYYQAERDFWKGNIDEYVPQCSNLTRPISPRHRRVEPQWHDNHSSDEGSWLSGQPGTLSKRPLSTEHGFDRPELIDQPHMPADAATRRPRLLGLHSIPTPYPHYQVDDAAQLDKGPGTGIVMEMCYDLA
jgi:hypothetical protein